MQKQKSQNLKTLLNVSIFDLANINKNKNPTIGFHTQLISKQYSLLLTSKFRGFFEQTLTNSNNFDFFEFFSKHCIVYLNNKQFKTYQGAPKSMEDESQNAQLKAAKTIQANMTKVLQEGPSMEALIQDLNPSNSSELTKKMIEIIGLIEQASPQIEKFSRKIIYASKQVTKEVDGNTVVEERQNGTKIQPFLNENLGTLEHAIVEQIQLIDSEKKETLSYEDLNEALSTRVFYTNKTLDLCIDYLLKKL